MISDRRKFLFVALTFEGSLIGVAHLIARWRDLELWGRCEWSAAALGAGLAATVPPFGLFLLAYLKPLGPLRRLKELLLDGLGPSIALCRWYDLLALAAVAGVGEELLFRGALQPWLGLGWSNVLFGLAHSATLAYAGMAGAIGVYLGWLFETTDSLAAPIITHSLYDFLAFLIVARDSRRPPTNPPPADSGAGASGDRG